MWGASAPTSLPDPEKSQTEEKMPSRPSYWVLTEQFATGQVWTRTVWFNHSLSSHGSRVHRLTEMKRSSGVKQEQRDPAGLRHLSAELCHSRLRREVCPQLVLSCGCRDLYYLSMYISRLEASRSIKDWQSTSAPHFVSSLSSKILNQTMWPVRSNSLEICKGTVKSDI